jgi:hypothetical protein
LDAGWLGERAHCSKSIIVASSIGEPPPKPSASEISDSSSRSLCRKDRNDEPNTMLILFTPLPRHLFFRRCTPEQDFAKWCLFAIFHDFASTSAGQRASIGRKRH